MNIHLRALFYTTLIVTGFFAVCIFGPMIVHMIPDWVLWGIFSAIAGSFIFGFVYLCVFVCLSPDRTVTND